MDLFDALQKNDHIVDDEHKYPNSLVVCEKKGSDLLVAPNGGGFIGRIPKDRVNDKFRKVEEAELSVPWRAANFSIEGEKSYAGYHWNDRWNGWACPAFPLEVAKEIMADFNKIACEESGYLSFDEDADKFVHTTEFEGLDEPEIEDTEGRDIQVDGKTVRVYAIGAYSWIWSEDYKECEVCGHIEPDVGPLSSNEKYALICDDCKEEVR